MSPYHVSVLDEAGRVLANQEFRTNEQASLYMAAERCARDVSVLELYLDEMHKETWKLDNTGDWNRENR